MRFKKISHMLMLLAVAIFLPFQDCNALVTESDAILAITVAEDSLELAYLRILDVEKAGGDINLLVSDLNRVLERLSDCKNAFKTGNYETAVSISKEVVDSSRTIIDVAQSEKLKAESEKAISMRNQFMISILSSSIIIVLGYVFWAYFKSSYLRRMLLSKPEVTDNES